MKSGCQIGVWTRICAILLVSPAAMATGSAAGPLRVHPQNPRYFADGSGKAILLTGSHTWNSLVDTDHIWGVGGNHGWVWRSFLRGHNPIFMDPYDGSDATVDLTAARGTLSVEWMNPADGTTTTGDGFTGGQKRTFRSPFGGDAVLYVRKVQE